VTIRFLAVAIRELNEAAEYYDRQRAGLGNEFREEMRKTINQIVAMPESLSLLSPNTRRCRVKRFPYAVVFAIEAGEIVTIAISHQSRHPDHWRDRL
jgi:hypothetical protein